MRDLNGDGISELIILTQEYEIRAIYSQVERRPVLVDAFYTRYSCVLDTAGIMYVEEIGGASDSYNAAYRISPYKAKPELIFMVGMESYHKGNGLTFAYALDYFIRDGEKTIIGEDVAGVMWSVFPSEYPDNPTRHIGLDVIPLYGAYPWIISEADGYQGIIRAYWAYAHDGNTNREEKADTLTGNLTAVLKGGTNEDNIGNDEFGLLSSCRDLYDDNLVYAIHDLNDDGISELLILTDDYSIRAIYSILDGRPVLIDAFFARNRCVLDTNGVLYVHGSDGASDNTASSCVIMPNTAYLTYQLTVSSETAYQHLNGFNSVEYVRYYCEYYGKTVELTPKEACAIWALFPDEYPDNPTQYVGLDIIPLY